MNRWQSQGWVVDRLEAVYFEVRDLMADHPNDGRLVQIDADLASLLTTLEYRFLRRIAEGV